MPPPTSNAMTQKRIHREIADLQREDMGEIRLAPSEDNILHWKAALPGPAGSPYENGVFEMSIELAPDYPFTAPRVTFLTRIYHMNISDRGGVCIDLLKHNWSPALSLYKVLLSLSSLLTDPNPHDPLVPSIAQEYLKNRQKHDTTAREWTKLYAIPTKSATPPATEEKTTETMATQSSRKGKGKSTETDEGSAGETSNPLASLAPTTIVRNGHDRQNPFISASQTDDATITVISDSDSDAEIDETSVKSSTAGSKRKRTVERGVAGSSNRTTRSKRKKGTSTGEAGSSSPAVLSDVIVIED